MAKKKGHEPKPRVLCENPHLQSMGASVKLKRKLFSQRELGLRPPWRLWLTFQKWFIRQAKKEGTLTCHYCGKSPLFKNSKITPPGKLATLDHVYPRAKGGREYDVNNIVVSCRPCNAQKADKVL